MSVYVYLYVYIYIYMCIFTFIHIYIGYKERGRTFAVLYILYRHTQRNISMYCTVRICIDSCVFFSDGSDTSRRHRRRIRPGMVADTPGQAHTHQHHSQTPKIRCRGKLSLSQCGCVCLYGLTWIFLRSGFRYVCELGEICHLILM